jgi:hypothetical protein
VGEWARRDASAGELGLSGLSFLALRREWTPMDAPAVVALIAPLVVGVGDVTWQGL